MMQTVRPIVGIGLAGLLVMAAACAESPPTAPSPQVTAETSGSGSLTALACPAGVQRIINGGTQSRVTFPLARVGGQAATKSECAPASGTFFPVGSTTVTCEPTAGTRVAERCAFSIRIASRALRVTRLLAFGDSITSGTTSPAAFPLLEGLSVSYPAQLLDRLRSRYPDQGIVMVNSGLGGETTPSGQLRLPRVVDAHRPDVVIIQEGINQLAFVGAERVAQNLESMVAAAQQRGATVLLANLLPIGDPKENRRPGTRSVINDVNGRIQGIAQRRGLGPVLDFFGLISSDPRLLGIDGLHPTEEGYEAMADLVLERIVDRWEDAEGPDLDPNLATTPSGTLPPGVDAVAVSVPAE